MKARGRPFSQGAGISSSNGNQLDTSDELTSDFRLQPFPARSRDSNRAERLKGTLGWTLASIVGAYVFIVAALGAIAQ